MAFGDMRTAPVLSSLFSRVAPTVAPAPALAPVAAPAPVQTVAPAADGSVYSAPVLDWATFDAYVLSPYIANRVPNRNRDSFTRALGLDLGGKYNVSIEGLSWEPFFQGRQLPNLDDMGLPQYEVPADAQQKWEAAANAAKQNPGTVYVIETDRINPDGSTSGGVTRASLRYVRSGAKLIPISQRDYENRGLTGDLIKGGILLAGAVVGLSAIAGATSGAATAAASTEVAGSGLLAGTGTVGLQIPSAVAVGTQGAGLTLSAAQVAAFAPTIGQTIAGLGTVAGLDAAISAGAEVAPAIETVAPASASTVGGQGLVAGQAGSGASGLYSGTSAVIGAPGSGLTLSGAQAAVIGEGIGATIPTGSILQGATTVSGIIQGGSLGEIVGAVKTGIGAVQTVGAAIGAVETVRATINPDGSQSLPAVEITGKKQSQFPWWLVIAAASAFIGA